MTTPELEAALATLHAENKELRSLVDCGGTNCGKCNQCRTVNEWMLTQANDDLKRENKELRAKLEEAESKAWQLEKGKYGVMHYADRVDALQARLKEAREVLEWYADRKNHEVAYPDAPIDIDAGDKARTLLLALALPASAQPIKDDL
jgi:bacterioferritin-associated ferredoxin